MKKKFLLLVCLLSGILPNYFASNAQENLDRGVVAVRSGNTDVFISWRLLESDPPGLGFNVYRSNESENAVKVNESAITKGTNFLDKTADLSKSNTYTVKALATRLKSVSGPSVISSVNAVAAVQADPYYTVNLRNGRYISFCWVGDLDGDGDFDFVVDRLGDGSSIPDKIEAYTNSGTFLWEVDYGPNSLNRDNIEPGSSAIDVGHWDGVTVADVNGDGKAEVITKIANGVRFGNGSTWTNSSNTKQWIAVLNGTTGALLKYSSVPEDFIAHGPMAAQMGVGNNNEIFVHMKNRQDNGVFNAMDLCYSMGSSLTLKWKRTNVGANGHQIRIVDVNGDGTDDLAHIGYVLNGSNGNTLYTMNNIVHGDRFQIGKFDPNRSGLQGYGIQQVSPYNIVEYYYDASNGQILWTHAGNYDNGRGNAADLDPNYPGYEVWSFEGLFNASANSLISSTAPWPNFRLWWDGDDGSELYDDGKIEGWNYEGKYVERLLTTWNYAGASGSARGAPLFYGDIIGDWREEVILKNSTYNQLVIFTTNIPTTISRPSLTNDRYYRNCLTTKGYMQSHYTSYYLGEGGSGGGSSNYYNIQNRHSGKCLRVENSSTSNNAYFIQEPCNSSYYSMQYELLDAGDSYLYIKNRTTEKCMRAVDGYLVQYDCNTGWYSEMFSRQDVGGGYYLLKNRSTGTCLRVENSSTADGARFVLEACNTGYYSQHFSFPGLKSATTETNETNEPVSEITIYPNPSNNGQFTLDISGIEVKDKVKIEVYSYDGKRVYAQEYTGETEIKPDLLLNKGIYMVVIKNDKQIVSKKLIIQ